MENFGDKIKVLDTREYFTFNFEDFELPVIIAFVVAALCILLAIIYFKVKWMFYLCILAASLTLLLGVLTSYYKCLINPQLDYIIYTVKPNKEVNIKKFKKKYNIIKYDEIHDTYDIRIDYYNREQ